MQMSSTTSPVESISELDLRSKFLSEGCYPSRSLLRAMEKAGRSLWLI
jgi:hypothetical protein